jgi:hypothetical protein
MSPDASWISRPRIDELTRLGKAEKYWPISPDVIIEVKSDSDDFTDTVAHTEHFRSRGSAYAVAIDPETREVVEFGIAPEGLRLDLTLSSTHRRRIVCSDRHLATRDKITLLPPWMRGGRAATEPGR